MRPFMFFLVGFTGSVLGACMPARDPAFAEQPPAQRVSARPPNEVRFDVRAGDRPVGTVELTTSGAYQATVETEQRTVIALSLKVTAAGEDALVVKPADLRASVETDKGSFADLEASGSSGAVSTAPGAPAILRAHFTLPAGVSPAAVQRFTLAWTVKDREGVAYQLATPFVQGPSGPAFAGAPAPSSSTAVAAREPSRSTTTYVDPYPYRYSYGGVWYSSDVHPWAGHGPPLVFVPDHHIVHPYYGGHFDGHLGGGHFGGGHSGGGHFGGGHSGHGGGGHHGGGHHRP